MNGLQIIILGQSYQLWIKIKLCVWQVLRKGIKPNVIEITLILKCSVLNGSNREVSVVHC